MNQAIGTPMTKAIPTIFMNDSTNTNSGCIDDGPHIKQLSVGAQMKNGKSEIREGIIGPGYRDKVKCKQLSEGMGRGAGAML